MDISFFVCAVLASTWRQLGPGSRKGNVWSSIWIADNDEEQRSDLAICVRAALADALLDATEESIFGGDRAP